MKELPKERNRFVAFNWNLEFKLNLNPKSELNSDLFVQVWKPKIGWNSQAYRKSVLYKDKKKQKKKKKGAPRSPLSPCHFILIWI